jgi:hypothetical protein
MATDYRIFWGDTHHNTYQYPEPRAQVPPLDAVLADVSRHMDFYTGAYYSACMRHIPLRPEWAQSAPDCKGIGLEDWKPQDRLDREWPHFQDIIRTTHRPGQFVTFPGYEWHGDGTGGDHNVVGLKDGFPLHRVQTVQELYAALQPGLFIAIPHHTGYAPTHRAPVWSHCNETLSPFAELFSVHGCSETDSEWVGLRRNLSMGPGVAGGTYEDALGHGLHLGAIASSDNWSNVPGHHGHGLMACVATELTRESLWEAFLARRVYGVSGDRILLEFTVNGACMGRRITAAGRRQVRVQVKGEEAIDRIELLRNGRVIATHCHQDTWSAPRRTSLFKVRIEAGWGAKPGTLPLADQRWPIELTLNSGRVLSGRTYRVSPDQGVPEIAGNRASVELNSRTRDALEPRKNACVFEFTADPAAELRVGVGALHTIAPVADLANGSRVLWDRAAACDRVRDWTGLDLSQDTRDDLSYHTAPKIKIHRVIPEAGYTATLAFDDDEPFEKEIHYRVRVEQRNGQRAWSSPVWVSKG